MSSKTIVLCASILFFLILLERNRYFSNNVINIYFKSEFRGRELVKRKLFADYLKRFNKSYGPDEVHKRFRNFKKNLREIERLNDGRNDAVFGVTKFSDWSKQELQQVLSPELGRRCDSREISCNPRGSAKRMWKCAKTNDGIRKRLPARKKRSFGKMKFWKINNYDGNVRKKLDWREEGAVGPVVDQGRCQICWAVSIAGVMASRAAIRGHSYQGLSIQQLIDCSYYHEENKRECGRGRPLLEVFEFLCSEKTRLATDVDYPLTNADEKCKHVPGVISLKRFNNECDMYKDESKLVEALNDGPVTALVWAELLFSYDSGVISWHCQVNEDELNHAVQIVGYDTTSNPPYYIIKNSWGDDWGEGGYVRLAIGGNQCGIAYSIGILDV